MPVPLPSFPLLFTVLTYVVRPMLFGIRTELWYLASAGDGIIDFAALFFSGSGCEGMEGQDARETGM